MHSETATAEHGLSVSTRTSIPFSLGLVVTRMVRMVWCAAAVIALLLAALATEIVATSTSAQAEPYLKFRQASYHKSNTLIQYIGANISRVSEGDTRAHTRGMQINIYSFDFPTGEMMSFDFVMGGNATIGEDYSIHPDDISSNRCQTAVSTRCTWNITSKPRQQKHNISFIIHDDDFDEANNEYIDVSVENLVGGVLRHHQRYRIQIRDDDVPYGEFEVRAPVYGGTTTAISRDGTDIYRVNEGDERAISSGVRVFFCAEFTQSAGTMSFDLELGGSATLGLDYKLHPYDIQPDEFLTSESTNASYSIWGRHNSTECRTVTLLILNDSVDELRNETITLTVGSLAGAPFGSEGQITIRIRDNDHDSAATFHTLTGTTLPSILSEDLFDRERGTGNESYDPSKNYLIAARGLPRRGVTTLEITFRGTAQYDVDYVVTSARADDVREGMVLRNPRRDSPLLRWSVWKEGQSERRFWFRIKVLDDRIEEDTESIIIDINPGNLVMNGTRGPRTLTLRLFDNDRPAPAASAGVTFSSAPEEISERLTLFEQAAPGNFEISNEVTLSIPGHPVILTLSLTFGGTAERCENYLVSTLTFSGDNSGTGQCNRQASTATFRIAQRATEYKFRLKAIDDVVYDPEGRTIVIDLGENNQGNSVRESVGVENDDDLPVMAISSPRVVEGNAGDFATLEYRLQLSGTSSHPVTVDYEISSDSTASSDETAMDFTHTVSSPITFATGDTEARLEITANGDSFPEADETVIVRLSNPVNAAFANAASTIDGIGTIKDNDLLELSIADASATEGNTGESAIMTFVSTLSYAITADVTVAYQVTGGRTDGEATAGEDFTPVTGTLTFPQGGSLTQTLEVTVLGDDIVEPNETFTVTLFDPQCSGCPDGVAASIMADGDSAIGTILDNESVQISISSPEVEEGGVGDAAMLVFEVTLDQIRDQTVSVSFGIISGGTAVSGTDFAAIDDGELTFNHSMSETLKTISVPVTGDSVHEANETVFVELTNPTGGAVLAGSASASVGTGTINNDDNAPLLIISTPEQDEGDAGELNILRFVVTKEGETELPVSVQYAFDSSSTVAVSGEGMDIDSELSSPLSFTAVESTKAIEVDIIGDDIAENDETVVVTLFNAENARFASRSQTTSGTGTIRNDDQMPLLAFGPLPTVTEGGAGDTATLRFEVIKEGLTALPAMFTYAITGTAVSAGNDADFTHTGSSLSIPANQASAFIDIAVNGDDLAEGDETVIITLSSAVNARFVGNAASIEGTGTIDNDDFLRVSLESEEVAEGRDGSTSTLTFTATLTARSFQPVTVDYEVITTGSGSGTANHGAGSAGTDYTVASPTGRLTFAANTVAPQMRTIEVTVLGDHDREPDETVVVRLHRLSANAEFIGSLSGTDILGTGTILNDDDPTFEVDEPRIDEGGEGETATMTFVVTMSPGWHEVVTVDYETTSNVVDGGATAGVDFHETSGTLTFNPGTDGTSGETVRLVMVEVLGDEYDEVDEETVTLMLSNASSNARIQTAEWTGIIVDDDPTPVFSIDSPGVVEGDSGTTSLVFTVTRSGNTRLDTSVEYAVSDGTATGGEESTDDYRPLASDQLGFLPSESTKQIAVEVNGDDLAEVGETLMVTLSSPVHATLNPDRSVGTGTIVNDDDFALSINSPSTTEVDNGETSILTFAVTLEAETPADVSVDYEVTGGMAAGEAIEGVDFTATSGTMTFATGGILTQEFDVIIAGDTRAEGRETLTATLSSPACALCPEGISPRIETGSGTGTIIDNDAPLVAISFPSVTEGNSGDSQTLDFEVTLDIAWGQDVSVNFDVAAKDGTATIGDDFEDLTGGTLTFDSSQSEISKTIQVPVIGDTLAEDDETIVIMLSGVSGGGIFIGGAESTAGIGTIRNDDFSYTVESSHSTIIEPVTDLAELFFDVTLEPAVSSEFHLRYSFGGTASEGFDFTDATQTSALGVLSFFEGESSKTIRVLVHSDFVAEGPEIVTVALSDEQGVFIPLANASSTILPAITNIDAVTLEVASPQVNEGEDGELPVVEFDMRLSEAQTSEVTISWVLSEARFDEFDQQQLSPLLRAADRRNIITNELASGTITLPVGASDMKARAALNTGVALVGIEGQLVIEVERPAGVAGIEIRQSAGISPSVQAAVNANGRVAAAVFDAPDTGPIPLNEGVRIFIEGPSEPVIEPEGTDNGMVELVYTVTLTQAAANRVTVRYTFSGSAVEGVDFTDVTMTANKGSLEYTPGDTRSTIRARVNSDLIAEEEEIVTVALSEATGAVLESGRTSASGTILPAVSTETAVKLSVTSPRVVNGESDGPPTVKFNLHLSDALSDSVEVNWVLNEAREDSAHRLLSSGSITMQTVDTTVSVSKQLAADTTIRGIEGQLVLEMERPDVPGVVIEQSGSIDGELQAEAHANDRIVVVVFSAGSPATDWATASALAGFGRSAAIGLVNVVWSRAEAHRNGSAEESHASLGGRAVDFRAFSADSDARRATRETARFLGIETVDVSEYSSDRADKEPFFSGGLHEFRKWANLPDGDRIVGRSSFALALGEGAAGGSSVVYWGAGSNGSFGSELEHDDGEFSKLTMDGSTTSISLGVDYRMSESMLLGVAMSSVSGSVEYSFAGSEEGGELSPSLTNATPWLRWLSSAGLEIWGAIGIGSGSAEAKSGEESAEFDLSSQTIAVGFWNQVASYANIGIAAKGDAFIATLSTDGAGDDVDSIGADSQRIRLAAEMTPERASSADSPASYSFEMGLRQDSSDAESGVGVDAAANFAYTSPSGSLQVSGRGSFLLFHGQEGFSETGLGLGVSFDPGGDARGIHLSLEPAWNSPRSNVADSMWNVDSSSSLSRSSSDSVAMLARLGFGIGMAWEHVLANLYGEAETSGSDQRLRLGTELRGLSGELERLSFDLYGESEESRSGLPEHALMVEVRTGF